MKNSENMTKRGCDALNDGKVNVGVSAKACIIFLCLTSVSVLTATILSIVLQQHSEIWKIILIAVAGTVCAGFPLIGATGINRMIHGRLERRELHIFNVWRVCVSVIFAVILTALIITLIVLGSILNDPEAGLGVNDVQDYLGEELFDLTGLGRWEVNTVAIRFCVVLGGGVAAAVLFASMHLKTSWYFNDVCDVICPDGESTPAKGVAGKTANNMEYVEFYIGEPPAVSLTVSGIVEMLLAVGFAVGIAVAGSAAWFLIPVSPALLFDGAYLASFRRLVKELERRSDEILDAEDELARKAMESDKSEKKSLLPENV